MTQITDAPTILIVDDTPSNLGMVVNLLEGRGYRVSIAQDGEEGLQRAQLLRPDLILLDVMMPGADGFEICRRLKELESTRDITVMFMTALVTTEHKVKGFAAGGVDYLSKPLHVDEVMARVDTHIKLHVAQRQLEAQNALLEAQNSLLEKQNSLLEKQRDELEQRVAERTEELAQREREFRMLAENQPDNLARYDKHCRIVYWNPQLGALLEKGLREAAGKTPLESSPGTRYVDYQAHLAETIATGEPREMELMLPDMGAGVRYHYIRFVVERDDQGDIIGALTIGRDITESKVAERELKLLNSALDNSFDAAYLLDTNLRLRYVNDAAVRELGYSREELLSMSLPDIDPHISVEAVREMMRQTVEDIRFPGTIESKHRRKNGESFCIEVGAASFAYEGERLFLTSVRDITERKQAERLLHEREQAIRAVVENSPDAIARYDAKLRRIYVNHATQKLYGLPLEQIIGKTIEELAPAPDDFAPILRSVFKSGEELRIELPFSWANGEKGWADVRIVPEFGADGSIVTVLAIGRDIAERKLAEDSV